MKYKAAFFDRDGTLTYNNPEKINWRDSIVAKYFTSFTASSLVGAGKPNLTYAHTYVIIPLR